MKTSELIGPALDWAVAKCEEITLAEHTDGFCSWLEYEVIGFWHVYSPSTDWAQGGPIIERENIGIGREWGDHTDRNWLASADAPDASLYRGPTPLIAAMRCYCCAKLGDEIEIPEELSGERHASPS
jgi:hypothetical protein